MLPGPPDIWESEWVNVPATAVGTGDIAHWPYTTGLLVKWVAFLGPAGGLDLGVGGASHVELLILYELWAGERLSLEQAVPRYLRPLSFSWMSCWFSLVVLLVLGVVSPTTRRQVPNRATTV